MVLLWIDLILAQKPIHLFSFLFFFCLFLFWLRGQDAQYVAKRKQAWLNWYTRTPSSHSSSKQLVKEPHYRTIVVVLLISSHFASEYEACKCYLKKHRSHKSCQQKRCDGPRLVLLVAYHSYRFLIVHHLPFVTAFNRPPLPRSFCFCFLPDNADSNLCLCKCRCKRPYRQEPRLIPWALHSRLHLELLEPLFLLE